MTNKAVKINFRAKADDDGYPPVAVESLWANPAGDGYLIDSIPFFTQGDERRSSYCADW